MALTFQINSVDRRANLRDGSLSVEKYFGVEVLTCQVFERSTPGASAYRPTLGQSIYVKDGTDLVFGGTIVERREETVWMGGGVPSVTLNSITAKSYETLADSIVVDSYTVASQGVLNTAAALHTAYLSPLSVTNIGSLTGGPTLPALEFDHQTLSAIFAQLSQLSGFTWRINGDKQFAFVAPGGLSGPSASESTAYDEGFAVEQSRVLRATRLFLRTGGTGVVTHTEGRTLNGTQTTFLLNVEPKEAPTTVIENGSPLAIGGGTWTYHSTLKAIVRSSGGTNGHAISVSYPVEFPAWVRCWDASVQAAAGTWVTASLVDAIVEASEQTDLAQAKAWGDAELARRVAQPLTVTFKTRTKGYYPLQQVSLTFADSNVSGNYLVQSVRVDATDDENVVYTVTCVEGTTLNENWFDFFKERGGTSSGGVAVIGSAGSSGSTTAGTAPLRIPLGGDNYWSDNQSGWTDIANAVPLTGSAALAGTYTLRTPRYVKGGGGTSIELRLYDTTNASVIASVSGTTSSTWATATTTVTLPASAGVCLLQYRMVSGTAEGVVGQCVLERD